MTDCIFYDGCYLPTRLCDDDCYRYDKEGKHPFEDDGQADTLREQMKDRKMMEGDDEE